MALTGALLVLPIVILIAAMVLLIAGLRGRQVDDHPLCRRCGFDLVGLPEGGTVCSECGANLHRDRAIRTGHRVRRAGMIVLSLALLLPSLLWVGVVGYVTAADVNWMSHKPVWLLLRDADTDGAALAELLTRLNNGKLSATDVNRVVTKALAVQADSTRLWNGSWGDLIERARVVATVSEADWARYLQQAATLDLKARREVARGDPIWVEVTLKELRVGTTWKPDLMGSETLRRIDGEDCGDYAVGGFFFSHGSGDRTSGSLLRPDPTMIAALPAGAKTLSVNYRIAFSDFHGQPVPEATAGLATRFTIREPPPPTVAIERNVAIHEEIQFAAQAFRVVYFPSGDLSLDLQLSAPPSYDLAYDVFAVLPDGSERRLSSFATARATSRGARCTGKIGRLASDVKTIDLVLRPSSEVALQTFTLTRLCAGEIRMKNVAIRRADDPARSRVNHPLVETAP